MIPNALDIVTAITIVLIGLILTLYLLILRRNGWIGKTSHYRCPNPQCQKIFQTPVRVKELSSEKETRLACPECGYDLGILNGTKGAKQQAQKQPELTAEKPVSTMTDYKMSDVNNSKEDTSLEMATPIVEPKEQQSPQINQEGSQKQKAKAANKCEPAGCNHYVGFLGSLPKGAETRMNAILARN